MEFTTFDADGDYIVTSAAEADYWVPVTRKVLARRIDGLIGADIKAIQRSRGQ